MPDSVEDRHGPAATGPEPLAVRRSAPEAGRAAPRWSSVPGCCGTVFPSNPAGDAALLRGDYPDATARR